MDPGPGTRPLSTYDISELAAWVDSHDYQAAWLDPATGEVWPAFDGGPPRDANDEEIDLRRDRLGTDREWQLACGLPGDGGLRRVRGRSAGRT